MYFIDNFDRQLLVNYLFIFLIAVLRQLPKRHLLSFSEGRAGCVFGFFLVCFVLADRGYKVWMSQVLLCSEVLLFSYPFIFFVWRTTGSNPKGKCEELGWDDSKDGVISRHLPVSGRCEHACGLHLGSSSCSRAGRCILKSLRSGAELWCKTVPFACVPASAWE